jgi:hypothetical protein
MEIPEAGSRMSHLAHLDLPATMLPGINIRCGPACPMPPAAVASWMGTGFLQDTKELQQMRESGTVQNIAPSRNCPVTLPEKHFLLSVLVHILLV